MSSHLGDQIIGHATVLHVLEAALKRPAPAYLFVGQPHLGKRLVAERFIAALLANPDISSLTHPDLVVLEVEEGKKQISVEQVREARARLFMRPMLAPRMVAYVSQADRLNESGTNALLKILEEPPADAVFVLSAEDAGQLPATLMSRVVKVPFEVVPKAQIVDALLTRGLSQAEVERRAVKARGRPGLALVVTQLGEEAPSESLNASGGKFVSDFFSAPTLGLRLALIEQLAQACDSSDDPQTVWREVILEAMWAMSRLWTTRLDEATLFGLSLVTAMHFIGSAVSPRLALEAGALRLSGRRVKQELRQLLPVPVPRSLPLIYAPLV